MTILIVEDNPVSAKMLELNLRKNGYRAVVANDAAGAIEQLGKLNDIQLVITDIIMPEMSGLELIKLMKDKSEWHDIPIIVSTCLADIDTVKSAVELGCKHYLVKPIKEDLLLQKVKAALMTEKPVMRYKDHIMAELGLDDEAYEEIRQTFSTLVDKHIDSLENAVTDNAGSLSETDVKALWEGASLIGAMRLLEILDKISVGKSESGSDDGSILSIVLFELKALKSSL